MAEKLFRPAVLVTVSLGLASCGTPAAAPARSRITPSYNHDTGRLEKITYDRNGDGKVDAWTVMNGTTLVRAELDDNFDGVVDRWEFYAPSTGQAVSAGPAVLTRVEISARPDGKVSRREFYEHGIRTRAEEDTDGDGRVDKWETWSNGVLTAVALDTRGRGRPDRRLVYDAGGAAPRLEVDADGSGRFGPAPAR
jgi:hypothetical protein